MNPIARLNAVEANDEPQDDKKVNDEELQLFSNTTFFDLDMGRSTDIATTVDELLMQQEKQIQYPQKQQPFDYLNSVQNGLPPPPTYDAKNYQFDLNTLQGFSMAEELPPTNLSIQDVDPMFRRMEYPHNQEQVHIPTPQPENPVHSNDMHASHASHVNASHANVVSASNAPSRTSIQSLTEPESPQILSPREESKPASMDEDKRRRNTAASARFRIKKKQREQEIERNQKIMQKKIEDQEVRIKQLEMENEWLRKLAVERTTARQTDSLDELRQKLLEKPEKA